MANYNPNLVKLNRNYTFEEMAAVFGIHKNTVSSWVKNGLPCLKEIRPFLILGADARVYLKAQRVSKKQKCRPDEFFFALYLLLKCINFRLRCFYGV
jgi:hypothetical protein